MWRLKVEVFRFWFCFHWIMFFYFMRTWFSFYAFIYLVFFRSITMFTFHLILNDHIWCSFLFFEPILFMFWLQNRYKSSILKPKNRFYLFFGYEVDINQVHLNLRTDWDPNPKVHQVVLVLWRITNPDPNPIEPELIPNRIFI